LLKRDAVAKVVLNNLYKHTQLQETFGANMLALVDSVPKTLTLDQFLRHWVNHQVEVICRRTNFLLKEAKERQHILAGYLKALDAIDEVISLIRASKDVDEAREKLIDFLKIDEIQSRAILAMQLSRLAALERQKIQNEYDELTKKVEDFEDILAKPVRQRAIIKDELNDIVKRFGDERRTEILPYGPDVNEEELIPEEEVVITLTNGGWIKRTRSDNYRAQRRGGKGIKGASLREDDIIQKFFVTTTHNWLLFFTTKGRVFKIKGWEVAASGRDSKGQHIANLLATDPDEKIAEVIDLKNFTDAQYLFFSTKRGLVKKTKLLEFSNIRTNGLKAITLVEGDELISVCLANQEDTVILVSKGGQATRFSLLDEKVRSIGRTGQGVRGMRFSGADELLCARVIPAENTGIDLVCITSGGYAKRTAVSEYPIKGRGTKGVKVAKVTEARGELVGAVEVKEEDELLVIMQSGKVLRSNVNEIRPTSRATTGVIFARADKGDAIIEVTKNFERDLPETDDMRSKDVEVEGEEND
jgi:DNA gyrase subunit A